MTVHSLIAVLTTFLVGLVFLAPPLAMTLAACADSASSEESPVEEEPSESESESVLGAVGVWRRQSYLERYRAAVSGAVSSLGGANLTSARFFADGRLAPPANAFEHAQRNGCGAVLRC